jgi:hypothetical protein
VSTRHCARHHTVRQHSSMLLWMRSLSAMAHMTGLSRNEMTVRSRYINMQDSKIQVEDHVFCANCHLIFKTGRQLATDGLQCSVRHHEHEQESLNGGDKRSAMA